MSMTGNFMSILSLCGTAVSWDLGSYSFHTVYHGLWDHSLNPMKHLGMEGRGGVAPGTPTQSATKYKHNLESARSNQVSALTAVLFSLVRAQVDICIEFSVDMYGKVVALHALSGSHRPTSANHAGVKEVGVAAILAFGKRLETHRSRSDAGHQHSTGSDKGSEQVRELHSAILQNGA
ncbi:hypothetical protein C8R47DRAFT_1074054 [Mycena vitilis]|nr:hypothetical protein C8R47DRAFT_1074054 [Mycena vitilis]